jgi:two-component system, sensor histidine kinase RegB
VAAARWRGRGGALAAGVEQPAVTPAVTYMTPAGPRVRGQARNIGTAQAINLGWLIKLRWGAIAGQVVTIAVVRWLMDTPLELTPLAAVVTLEVVTNLGATLWRRRGDTGEGTLVLLLAADVLFLTALLSFSGGSSNPFSFLYLVHIALAAVVLRSGWTWILVALSMLASGTLFLWEGTDHGAHGQHMRLHLEGMWVAFTVAAAFIVYFVTRVRRALADREADLSAERQTAARNEKLAALATLAAGAAHELATPLGTIAVISRELERRATGNGAAAGTAGHDPGLREDLALIRQQVDRCRQILDGMAAEAGEGTGEGFTETTVRGLFQSAMEAMNVPAGTTAVRDATDAATAATPVMLPVATLAQAIRGLLRNALDASAGDGEVTLHGRLENEKLVVQVNDRGTGMAPEVLARAGEPFFTTKPPGSGMGLGLFLTRSIAERLGGGLELRSVAGQGTSAVLRVPRDLRDRASVATDGLPS